MTGFSTFLCRAKTEILYQIRKPRICFEKTWEVRAHEKIEELFIKEIFHVFKRIFSKFKYSFINFHFFHFIWNQSFCWPIILICKYFRSSINQMIISKNFEIRYYSKYVFYYDDATFKVQIFMYGKIVIMKFNMIIDGLINFQSKISKSTPIEKLEKWIE